MAQAAVGVEVARKSVALVVAYEVMAQAAIGVEVARKIIAFINQGSSLGSVNFPDVRKVMVYAVMVYTYIVTA